jgi:hypothetical protein
MLPLRIRLALRLIACVVFVAVLVSGCGAEKKDSAEPKQDSPKQGEPKQGGPSENDATVKLTAAEWGQEWKKDRDAAQAKYAGKEIELSGTVEAISWSTKGEPSGVFLRAADPKVGLRIPDVVCLIDDPKLLGKLGQGQTVRVRGKTHLLAGGPNLKPCTLVETGPDTVVRLTAEQIVKEYTIDPDGLAKRCKDRTRVVTGTVTAVKPNPDAKHLSYVELKGDVTTTIEVWFDLDHSDRVKKYKPGDPVKVVGSHYAVDKGVFKVVSCHPIEP